MVYGGRTDNPDDVLYLNDGNLNFTSAGDVPSASGSAQQVITLDPNAGPRDAFLALNGFGRDIAPGRIQLLRMVPAN